MNILYTEVDSNLRNELDARASAGMFSKTTKDLQYMIEKIANVEIIAYEESDSDSTIVGRLGGFTTRLGRFMPNGPEGYLQNQKYSITNIEFDDAGRAAKLNENSFDDASKRVGPYATTVDVTIGDHSMGLLNKASIALSIPNPKRDLDIVESTWFRPGRFVRIVIVHPESAVITRDETGGILTDIKNSIDVAQEKLIKSLKEKKKQGADIFIPKKRTVLPKMNEVFFEGLITSFDFSFQANGAVDASLSLTGTSNVYTEVSMYMNNTQSEQSKKENKKKINENPVLDPKVDTERKREILENIVSGSVLMSVSGDELITSASMLGATPDVLDQLKNTESASTSSSQFYDAFYDNFTTTIESYKTITNFEYNSTDNRSIMAPTGNNDTITDSFILEGYSGTLSNFALPTAATGGPTPLIITNEHFYKYVSLGHLIQYINDNILTEINKKVPTANIYCDDSLCFSNYYKHLTSCIPEEILFLPPDYVTGKHSAKTSELINSYGTNVYYEFLTMQLIGSAWKGSFGKIEETDANGNVITSDDNVIFPTRIFINIDTIREIIVGTDGKGGISAGGSRGFNLKTFLSSISKKISYATGRAIDMSVMTHPDLTDMLLYTDRKYSKSKSKSDTTKVEPYHVPIYQDTGKGTLVRNFTLSATIPESVKNLSYVLNQKGEDISEEEIAPYVNFMYQKKDVNSINKAYEEYTGRHKKAVIALSDARKEYGNHEGVIEKQHALYKALIQYIKYPADDIRVSNLLAAPIFPFTADFEIDGINGFRYGDVLQFDALPMRYRMNTVFSVISVSHNLTVNGEWTTNVKCIMRPSIE